MAAGFIAPQGSGLAQTQQKPEAGPEGRTAPTTTTSHPEAGPKPSTCSRPPFRLPGRPALEAFLNEHVIHVIENAEQCRAFGIDFPAAVVLHGPPGCGKTFVVERLGHHLDWPVFPIDSSSVASPYLHETSKKVGEVFDQARDGAPSLVVIDEMESHLSDRQIHSSTGLHHRETLKTPKPLSQKTLTPLLQQGF